MDAFKLWWWRSLLRVPWTAREWNQSILKEINPEYSLEGLMLKLKLQYFGHLLWRADSFEKTLMLVKSEGRRRGDDRGWEGWMASGPQWTWFWANSRRWWRTGKSGVLSPCGHKEVRHELATEVDRWSLMLRTFSYTFLWLFVFLFLEDVYSIPLWFLNHILVFLLSLQVLYTFWSLNMYQIYYLKNLTPFHRFSPFSSVAQSCPNLCDPMNRRMPGFPVNQ